MKAQLQTRNGKLTIDVPVISRYRIVAKPGTTDSDWTQFWTWVKYEVRADHNTTAKVIGCNPNTLDKIKTQWADKFYFDN